MVSEITNNREISINNKIVTLVLSFLVSIIMTITWFTARDSMTLGVLNKVNIAEQKAQTVFNTVLLTEVRDDVKTLLKENGYKE